MKNMKSLIAVATVAVAAISMAPKAQAQTFPGHPANFPGTAGPGGGVGNRTLSFSPNTAFSTVDGDGQTSFAANNISTVVHVRPYLFVTGVLGGEWDVDGWGDGTLTTPAGAQHLDIYHSNPFTVGSSGWADPTATSGTAATHSIPMTFSLSSQDANGASLGGANYAAGTPITQFNQFNNVVVSPDTVASTNPTFGHYHGDFTFTLSPNETTYSGTYSMNPTFTFTNQ